jgi:hypothetical protein
MDGVDLPVADAFVRTYGVVDRCAFFLESVGPLAVGERRSAELLEQLGGMIREFAATQAAGAAAARELSGRLLAQLDPQTVIFPEVEQPFECAVQARSPVSMALMEAFRQADAVAVELETLRWNGLRSSFEVRDEIARIKRSAGALARYALRVNRHLHARLNGKLKGEPDEARPQGPAA